GVELAAPEFARPANAVDVTVLDCGSVDQTAEALYLAKVIGSAAPDDGRLRLLRVELQGERAVVEAADEQDIAGESRGGDRRRGPGGADVTRVLFAPVFLARLRIERVDRLAVPDDELALAASLENDRRGVPDLLGRQRAPQHVALV